MLVAAAAVVAAAGVTDEGGLRLRVLRWPSIYMHGEPVARSLARRLTQARADKVDRPAAAMRYSIANVDALDSLSLTLIAYVSPYYYYLSVFCFSPPCIIVGG